MVKARGNTAHEGATHGRRLPYAGAGRAQPLRLNSGPAPRGRGQALWDLSHLPPGRGPILFS